jgi:hypothetical protein
MKKFSTKWYESSVFWGIIVVAAGIAVGVAIDFLCSQWWGIATDSIRAAIR